MNKFETLAANIASFSVGLIIGASVISDNGVARPMSAGRTNTQKPPIEEKKAPKKKIGFVLGNDER